MSRHDGVSCDSCTASNFSGRRFKCLVCSDYDLCANCYDRAQHGHPPHPMQCLLNKKDFLVHFGETYKTKAQSFTCPCCGQMGFSLETLTTHARTKHHEAHERVLCPVCVANRHALHPSVTQDILTHLQREHSLGSGVRDIVALLEDPTGGVINRRNNLQLRFPDNLLESSSAFSSHLAQSVESVRPFNELLSHISNRCNEIGPVMLPRNVSKSHSKLSQGVKLREKGVATEATSAPSNNSSSSKQDYSDRFVSRSLSITKQEDEEPVSGADKGEFIRQLLVSSLDERNTVIPDDKKQEERLEPPPVPPCLAGTSIFLPKCVEGIPCSPSSEPEQPPSRVKQTNRQLKQHTKSTHL